MEHTVHKKSSNRIALRSLGLIFVLIAVLRFVVLLNSHEKGSVVITLLCTGCMLYGLILLWQTFKPQAYDITYVFGDKTKTLKMHKKERIISYGDISDIGYVVPNPNLDYSIVQIYVGKEQFLIPFTEKTEVGKALYGMLKLKKEEALKEMNIEEKECQ